VSYLPALFGTIAVYILLAILLLSLNIASLWRWWVKLGAIVITTGVFIVAYVTITGLIGWPSPQAIPGRFSLLATRIIEPDKASGAPGHLYMWVEAIDDDNLPVSQPRNHEVVYTVKLANALYAAQQKLNSGQEVLGEMLDEEQNPQTEGQEPGTGDQGEEGNEASDAEGSTGSDGNPQVGAASNQRGESGGDGYLLDVTDSLQLSDMPPPDLPDKS
jgi:hypothetical protein